jgi:hypothetical protein
MSERELLLVAKSALEGMIGRVMGADAETVLSTPWMSQCTDNKLKAAREAVAHINAALASEHLTKDRGGGGR